MAERAKIREKFVFFIIYLGFIVFNECRVSKHQRMDELTTKKLSLTHFRPMVPFYTPWKHHKTRNKDYPIPLAHQKQWPTMRIINTFFFYLGFLSRPFTHHRTAGEGGGHFFNSSLQLPPASQTLTRAITTESSPLHIGSSRSRTGNLWFPSASR